MRIALALALAGVTAVAATASAGSAASGVPQGFRPETAAAVGSHVLWVLGEYPCGASWCLALVRSTDSGTHFERVAPPPFPSQGTVPSLAFANTRDGFAYVRGGRRLFSTHDGGATWHPTGPIGQIAGFAVGSGEAYVVAGRLFARSPVDQDVWRPLKRLRSREHLSLAARGSDVWLLGAPRHHPDLDTIMRSTDRGRRLASRTGPCLFDLGGGLVPTSGGVVWAVCPTGMMAWLAVSTNGGNSFRISSFHDPGALTGPSLTNGGQIAAASAKVAVLTRGGGGAFLRTTDTGRHWSTVPRTGRITSVFSLGFATKQVGVAIVQIGSHQDLWRTTDGGATWHSMPIR